MTKTSHLSGYRMMWMMVLFDLPVVKKSERKAATRFRNFLLDEGFQMSQYSVYMRFCAGKEQAETYVKRVEKAVPKAGTVSIIFFTDKQYEKIINFQGRARQDPPTNPEQFVLL